jgi:PAS domain S-box-containing protein
MVFQKQSKRKIDISNREQVEQMLRHLGMIAERAEEGIVVVDLKGVLHFVNTAWAVMHGYRNSSELLGKQVSAFYKEVETKTKVTALIKESKRKGTCIGQAEHMRRDKTTFPTRLKMTALKDGKGKASGTMVFATDITERKGLEQKLSEITRRDDELKEQIEQLRHKVTEQEQAEEQLKQQAGQLTAGNEALEQEIAKHKQTEDELKQLGERLLPRVEQQGTELTAVGRRLEQEIAGRKKAEDELKELRNQLEHQGAELTTSNKQLEQ